MASLAFGLCSISLGFVVQSFALQAIASTDVEPDVVVAVESDESLTSDADVALQESPESDGAIAGQPDHSELDELTALTVESQVESAEETDALNAIDSSEVQYAADLTESTNASALSEVDLDASVLEGSMAQVTSVTQLSDVLPTDWAYQALSSLIERYGCVAGYPDGTFRGNSSLSRYEFAAGLNACLEGFAASLSPDDLSTLDQLQSEFAAELAALRGRVDSLEAQIALLEANQFSTTTKLSGIAFFHFGAAGSDGDVLAETGSLAGPLALRPAARNSVTGTPIVSSINDDPELTFGYLLWLNFSTSFTGDDLLFTQFAVGNGDSPANQFVSAGLYNTYGVPFTDQSGGVNDDDFVVRELFYDFPVGDSLRVAVGPRINWYRYFDNNAFTFFLTGASSFNSSGSTLMNAVDRGAGAVVRWDINDQLDLNVAYLGENTEFLPGAFFNTATDPSDGLFGATNTLSVGLTYSPSSRANIRLAYTRSNIEANTAVRDENGNVTGFGVGGAISEPIYGVADDGFGGSINAAVANTFNANFDWRITDGFGIFSRYTYGTMDIDPLNRAIPGGSIDAQSFQAGLAFPDLGKDGALLTLSYLIPFSILDGEEFLASGSGDGGIQYEFEATYFYPLGNGISIAPTLYMVNNPNNFDENPTIWVGNLRLQYAF
jgi:hypothetical protein